MENSGDDGGLLTDEERLREHELIMRDMAWTALARINEHLRDLEMWVNLYEMYDGILGGLTHLTSADAERENLADEIAKCRNQREGVRRAAELQGGTVRVRDVARLIHESALSKGSLSSVRSALLRYVKGSDEWEEMGGGYFRLVGRGRVDGPRQGGLPSLPPRLSPVMAKARALRQDAEVAGGGDDAADDA